MAADRNGKVVAVSLSASKIHIRAGDCVMPREGVFARVVRGGRVAAGDAVMKETD